ncbi:glycosyltransferase [Roseococcus sp. SYP-B2431]|uniref:glycosyltransferase n=1 Tax=Roseococcus sp. SYP-B2431 TaxID=2496640 RepID=UPI00103F8BC3|nr:glycosyltransferase [Roseococcus sp. SYP-B2431]TCH97687.1 glycosyltransferase [Roseococcus sp. SYP-B2431]
MRLLGFFRRLRVRRAAMTALHAGNGARDARDWQAAAAGYRRYLGLRPGDGGVWVQLGHALKESGDLPAAESAYRRGVELAPENHDAHLQLGHALKMQGRVAEARAAYARSDELAPINHAAEELAALAGAPMPPRRPAGAPRPLGTARERENAARVAEARIDLARSPGDPAPHRALSAALLRAGDREGAIAAARDAFALAPDRRNWQAVRRAGGLPAEGGADGSDAPHLYDITDLLNLVRDTGRATGIQRVQLGLAQGILRDPEASAAARFVFLAERFGPLWTLAREDLEAIIAYCLDEPHDLDRAAALANGAMDRARPTGLGAARLFFIMGAFWFWAGAPAALARLRAAGLRIGVLVYDLIPVTHPEHTSEGTVAGFRQGLREGAQFWDFALTISEYTAGELRKRLAALEAPAIPVRPMPLAHRFNEAEPGDAFPEAAADLRGQDYILCVGTIESRKNHAALFQAWQLLIREGVEPPPLVLVGRPGWRVADLMAQLESTHYLDGRIRLLHGISDPELEGLYRGCLFTVFPSFTEGWGLPVGESLALGKLCLAAMEGATPEAGGGFAEPIDAFSPRDIAARIRHFLDDRPALAAAEQRLRDGFRPRGWPEVTRHFLAEVAEGMARPALQRPAPMPPRLVAGETVSFAATSEGWPESSLALGAGFEPPEEIGSWLLGPSGTVHLDVAAPARLWLRLAAAPWAEDNRAGVALGDGPLRWTSLVPGGDALTAIDVPAGSVTLRLVVDGPLDAPPQGETRPIRVGLRAITVAAPVEAALTPGRPVVFGPGAPDLAWTGLLAEGWDLAASPEGVEALSPRAVIRLRVPPEEGELRVLLHLAIRPGYHAKLRHTGGTQDLPEAGGPLLLPLSLAADAEGTAEIVLEMEDGSVPPLRLSALRWAAAGDTAGRLAMVEALVLPEAGLAVPAADRLLAIEARLRADGTASAAPVPGGEAGRAALRLAARRG